MPENIESLRLDSDRRMAMIAAGLALIPAVWYVRTDFALYAGDWPRLAPRLVTRALMVAIAAGALMMLRAAQTREDYSRIVLGYALLTATLILTINGLRPKGTTLPLRTPLYNIFVMYAALPNRFWRQCAPALILSAGLVLLRIFWLTSGVERDIAGDLVIIAILNTLGILLVRRRLGLEADLAESAHSEHMALELARRSLADLRTLRGIVPICSHCRKVRTEVGDWQQLELYVSNNSHAEFSHGICPACVEAHYEPYFREKDGGRPPAPTGD